LVAELRELLTLAMTFGTLEGPEQLVAQSAVLRELASSLHDDVAFGRAVDLARAAHQLAALGEPEAAACSSMLETFGRLAISPPDTWADPAEEASIRNALSSLDVSIGGDGQSAVLESIVSSAAQTIRAQYGSLFLVDESTQELVFAVSLRERLEELRRFRVPLGRGIAGLVAVTGQPIAVSDVAGDPRHARDIAEQTGYIPKNMLCVPLQTSDHVVGVLELLDKQGEDAFTLEDMQALGEFAARAAETIQRAQLHQSVVELVSGALRQLSTSGHVNFDAITGDHVFQQRLVIGINAARIARDADVSVACERVLRALTDYARAR
jgi:putative methionine-R-sulfoxide reductase with GAF domain